MRIDRLFASALSTLAVVLLCGSYARAERPKRVGVVVTVLVNVSEADAQELTDSLGAAIRKEFSVETISGVETDRRLPEGGVPDECVANVECRNDLGRRLDAEELLMLVILRIGDEIQIDSTWAQVASGDTASRPRIVIGPGADREAVLRKAAPRLLPHIKKPEVEKAKPEIIVVPQPHERQPAGKSVPVASWIAGGLSVAALAGGTVYALSARQKYQALEDEGCRAMPCDQKRIAVVGERALRADILFGVSGAAAVAALIFYIASPEPKVESRSTPTIGLRPGPGSVGLSLGTEF